jgi:hypothetical protein
MIFPPLAFLYFAWLIIAKSSNKQQKQIPWAKEKAIFEQKEQEKYAESEQLAELAKDSRQNAEAILDSVMSCMNWPRETSVSYEIRGDLLSLDVDFPEVEDMPETEYSATESGRSLKEKSLSDTRRRMDYARHIHGVGFYLIGEVFRSLDFVQEVIMSGYSQRLDKATGHTKDEYLYSVRVKREDWRRINFDNLENIDPVEALGALEMRREMSKTGIFKAIEPM